MEEERVPNGVEGEHGGTQDHPSFVPEMGRTNSNSPKKKDLNKLSVGKKKRTSVDVRASTATAHSEGGGGGALIQHVNSIASQDSNGYGSETMKSASGTTTPPMTMTTTTTTGVSDGASSGAGAGASASATLDIRSGHSAVFTPETASDNLFQATRRRLSVEDDLPVPSQDDQHHSEEDGELHNHHRISMNSLASINTRFSTVTTNVKFQEQYNKLNAKMDTFALLKELRQLVNEGKMAKATYDEIYKLQADQFSHKRDSEFSKGILALSKSSKAPSITATSLSATGTLFHPHSAFITGRKQEITTRGSKRGDRKHKSIGKLKGVLTQSSTKSIDNEKPVCQGYLFKWAKMAPRQWRRRYFVLYTTRLEYFVDEENFNKRRRRGTMWITEDFYVAESLFVNSGNSKNNGFMISDFTKYIYLAADAHETKHMWMHNMTKAIRKLQEISENKDEPVMIGKPARSPSIVKRDATTRLVEYKRNLMAYGATSPLEVEEKIKQGYKPNFEMVPSSEELLHEVEAEEKEIDETIAAAASAMSPTPPAVAPRPKLPVSSISSSEHKLDDMDQPLLGPASQAMTQDDAPRVDAMSAASGLLVDIAPIEERLRECRKLVDKLSDQHEEIRSKLAKANAEESKLMRLEEAAAYESERAEQKCEELKSAEVSLVGDIEYLKGKLAEAEAAYEEQRRNRDAQSSPAGCVSLDSPTSNATLIVKPYAKSSVTEKNRVFSKSFMTDFSEDDVKVLPVTESSPALLAIGQNFDERHQQHFNGAPQISTTKIETITESAMEGAASRPTSVSVHSRKKGWFSSIRIRSVSQPVPPGTLSSTDMKDITDPKKASEASSLLHKKRSTDPFLLIEELKSDLEAWKKKLRETQEAIPLAEADVVVRAQRIKEVADEKEKATNEVVEYSTQLREIQHNLSLNRDMEAKLMRARNDIRKNGSTPAANLEGTPSPSFAIGFSATAGGSRRRSKNPAQSARDSETEYRRRVSSAQALQIRKGRQSGGFLMKKMEMAELESQLVT